LLGFGLFPPSGILEKRKHDESETESQVKAVEDTYSLGLLERANPVNNVDISRTV
jgi:hypothetical protein